MAHIEEFSARIDAFLSRSGLSASKFGVLSCNDGAFVFDLRAGREPKMSTIKKVDKFMVDYATRHFPQASCSSGSVGEAKAMGC